MAGAGTHETEFGMDPSISLFCTQLFRSVHHLCIGLADLHNNYILPVAAFMTACSAPGVSIASLVSKPESWMMRATQPVQPVWWLAPIPAPLSPWKYS